MLDLRPWELDRATPAELVAMAAGRGRRDERAKWELAWSLSLLLSAWVRNPPQPAELMKQLVGEDRAAQLLREEMGRRRRPEE